MEKEIATQSLDLDSSTKVQIHECLSLLHEIFGIDLLGVYLYGSAIIGGLQKYSDIDLFVVSNRATKNDEKRKIAADLLNISGVYMKSKKRPIELTIVDKSDVNPWRYPPKFDFQYGDWLREEFESGNIEPWASKEMPDLALLITQVRLASQTLVGAHPDQLLSVVPYEDFISALTDAMPTLMSELDTDTRNVLLTFARIWSTVETDTIRSKPSAADWVINRLPEAYQPVMERARAICKGEENEHWEDIQKLIEPCADHMLNEATSRLSDIQSSAGISRSITIA